MVTVKQITSGESRVTMARKCKEVVDTLAEKSQEEDSLSDADDTNWINVEERRKTKKKMAPKSARGKRITAIDQNKKTSWG